MRLPESMGVSPSLPLGTLQLAALNYPNSFVDGPFGSDLKTEDYQESGIPLIQLNNITIGSHVLSRLKFISEEKANQLNRHSAKYGDIVIAKMADPVARAAIVGATYTKYIIVADCVKLSVNTKFCKQFVVYWMNSSALRQFAESLSTGTTRIRLNLSEIKKLPIPVLPLIQQRQIAAYLNRETIKIDRLIAKQEQLIELLQEKRRALISRAVTKGLDSNVKMKDSGVEWLGEVPEHWKVLSIKHIVSTPITDGPHETPQSVDEGVPFISAEAISSGTLNFEKRWGFISKEDHSRYSKKYCPKLHDIYMVKSGATTGVTAIVETEQTFNIWSPLAVIRCVEFMNPYFVLSFMRSRNFLDAVSLNWSFGTQQNIGMGVLENLQIPVPPLEEQESLVRYIYDHIEEVTNLVDRAKSSVELLKERRQALISAAVTGKIDVRNLVTDEEVAVLERVSESELNIDEAIGDEE